MEQFCRRVHGLNDSACNIISQGSSFDTVVLSTSRVIGRDPRATGGRLAHHPRKCEPGDGVPGGFQNRHHHALDRVFIGPQLVAVADGFARVAGAGRVCVDALTGDEPPIGSVG